ncbi:unnamed protein product [Notodromas monacha]|uniref:Uncharacterized protein n=1 Tax=Notodromas monacha TaxID=399045 RepID=A0A7R9GCW2_9CRUS|nr:unnamed protein product [Notodromas monacha]CAG0916515.1 unnamed protein product [Notodromas monacha]
MPSVGITRTGLIEARKNPLARRFEVRDEEVNFGDIVRRPPVAWKPFAFIRSPYRYGCSILCNHPVDPEFRGALRDKEIWFSGCRSLLTKEDFDRIQYMIHNIRTGSRGGSGNTTPGVSRRGSRRLSMIQDDGALTRRPSGIAPSVKISRPGSPVRRRCVTPDAAPRNREQFIVDLLHLRRTKSFDALSSATHATTDRDVWDGATERSVFSDLEDCFRIDVACVTDAGADVGRRRVVARLFHGRRRSSSAESVDAVSSIGTRTKSFDALSSATHATTDRDVWDGATERSVFSDLEDCFRIDVACVTDAGADVGRRRVVARLFHGRRRSSSAESVDAVSSIGTSSVVGHDVTARPRPSSARPQVGHFFYVKKDYFSGTFP